MILCDPRDPAKIRCRDPVAILSRSCRDPWGLQMGCRDPVAILSRSCRDPWVPRGCRGRSCWIGNCCDHLWFFMIRVDFFMFSLIIIDFSWSVLIFLLFLLIFIDFQRFHFFFIFPIDFHWFHTFFSFSLIFIENVILGYFQDRKIDKFELFHDP